MATPHIESEKGDIAKVVLMPGDPLRAKYIADNFLTDVRVVNNVRNIITIINIAFCRVNYSASEN